MKLEELKDERDREHAKREEARNRVRTYKDKPVNPYPDRPPRNKDDEDN